MCYDIHASLKSQLSRAKQNNDADTIKEIEEKLAPMTDLPLYHVSGFDHPQLLIYTNKSPNYPTVSTWGLIPSWIQDENQAKKHWNKTLNARSESIFETASFKDSAKNKRCIIYIDGFFEHYHYQKNTYPYYIYRKDKKAMALAGLWNEFLDESNGEIIHSFSIVTTKANDLMKKIHNNPKLSEARMPLILPQEFENKWLKMVDNELDVIQLIELISKHPNNELKAHTVNNLKGNKSYGNTEKVIEKVQYEALINKNYTLPLEF